MAISYKKLWKLLIDKDMKKKDLCEKAGISPASVTKMGRNGHVTTEILLKIRRQYELKEAGLWQEVRDRYLEKKNMYLSWQDRNHPSFVVYVEAVNEVYNRYFNRGGGCSVQSIF